MIPLDFSHIVRPELSADGLVPLIVDVPTVVTAGGLRYRAEPWTLVDGQLVVVIRGLDGESSCTAALVERIEFRWGSDPFIIEDWGSDSPRYRTPAPRGSVEVDAAALEARGVVLATDI